MSEMILPLEQQVPPRELCEQLRDAGFPQETFLVWSSEIYLGMGWNIIPCTNPEWAGLKAAVAAPTVGEMRHWLRQQGCNGDEFLRWRTDHHVWQWVKQWTWLTRPDGDIPVAESWWWDVDLKDADAHALTCLALLRAMKEAG